MELRRRKTRSRGDPDRLSELPDLLLVHILSSLEMTDAVKTGILSKRWKNLWTRVHNLVYKFRWKKMTDEQYDIAEEPQRNTFASFVDRTLKQHQSNIKKFSLTHFSFFYDESMSALLSDWIVCVLEKKVEVLELNGSMFSKGPGLPDCFFQSSSLTKLKLENFVLRELSHPIKWNLLKSLCLTFLSVSDEYMEKILLGCPVLESLALENIEELRRLNITSPSVRKLKLDDGGEYDSIFTINAPWIQELEMSGRLLADYKIGDVSSLVKASLMFTPFEYYSDYEDEDDLQHQMAFTNGWILTVCHVLLCVIHVAELSIGSEIIQVLSYTGLIFEPNTFQCKHLTINSPLWNYDILGILSLLDSAPLLETLVINVSRRYQDLPYDDVHPLHKTREHFENDHVRMDIKPNESWVHLKNVKIDYYRNPCIDNPEYGGGKCNDAEVVAYIMRSVVALERLIICSSSPGCTRSGCSKENCSFSYVRRLSNRLLTDILPGSEAEEWELKKRKYSYEYRFSNLVSLRSEVEAASEVGSS